MSTSDDVLRQLDGHAFAALYAAVSVDRAAVVEAISRRGLTRLDPTMAAPPRREDLDHTADALIGDAAGSVGALGGVAGLGGLVTLPPEAVAWLVSVLRLAQRLAVVYGFDTDTDRGRMALTRAVAAGFEVDLPQSGVAGMKLSDLFGAVADSTTSSTPDAGTVGRTLAKAMMLRTVRLMTGRLGRLVPVLSSGVSAIDNARKLREVGERMKASYGQQAELPARLGMIEDAVEL